jgi:hypothetical protein
MEIEVKLQKNREPLAIPYPADWGGKKSGEYDDETLLICTQPRWVTPEEATMIDLFLIGLPYKQALARTGAVAIATNDPLLNKSHDDLDAIERHLSLAKTRTIRSGGTRSVRERVLLIRERGYFGDGNSALEPSAVPA